MAPSCEHGGNGSRQRHSPKGKQIPPNSHSQPRVRGRKGFRTNSGEPAGRPAAGRTLRPAPLPAVTPAPAPRRSSAETAPPKPPFRARPLTERFLRSRPGLEQQRARSGGLPGSGGGVGSLLCRRNAASWPERLMESSGRCPSPLPPRSTPLSPPPQSETSSLLPAPPSRPPRVRPPRPSPAVPPPPLSGPRPRELPGWGGVARGGEASRAGEAGAPAAGSNLGPAESLPFYGNEGPGVGIESNIRALGGGT
nr:PREDICTED: uncharacterized protein LOC109564389 [Bos indicus]